MSSNVTHYVAPIKTDVVVDAVRLSEKKSNLWLDAWRDLRHRPLFWISIVLCVFVVIVSLWPSLFTSVPPQGQGACFLNQSNGGPTHSVTAYDYLGREIRLGLRFNFL